MKVVRGDPKDDWQAKCENAALDLVVARRDECSESPRVPP